MLNVIKILMVVCIGVATSFSLWSADADQQDSETAAAHGDVGESVEILLARAHLKLAKLDLDHFQEANKLVPNVFTTEFVNKLKLHVVMDEATLQERLKEKDADAHQVCIRSAEAALKIAEADVISRRASQQLSPSKQSDFRVQRAEFVAEIAKLNLERVQQLEDPEYFLAHLQGQIDELRHQVLELQMRR